MKNKLTSLGSRVVFCAVVMSLASTAFAGERGGRPKGQFRPIMRPGASEAAQARITDEPTMSGSLFNPSRNSGSMDRVQGLTSNPGDKR